ncbi:hypothetical protein HMI54_002894 [Coelomomyces lativittatus]|nr:hypothetical protein HMI54_002894 [Coelomomyces lativittatus]
MSAAPVEEKDTHFLPPSLSINEHLNFKPNEGSVKPIELRLKNPYIDFSFKNADPLEGEPSAYPACVAMGIFSNQKQNFPILFNACSGINCNWIVRSIFLENRLQSMTQFDPENPIHLPLLVRCQYYNGYDETEVTSFEWKFNVTIKTER